LEDTVDTREYHWRSYFVAALTKVDDENSLNIADDAIFNRLLELEGTPGNDEERQALEDTMQDIRMLRDRNNHFRI
jgi:hypothetical protein